MKVMKKVLVIVLCFTFIFTVFYFNSSAKTITDGDFTYDVNDVKGIAVITKYKGNDNQLVIPDTFEDYSIVGINSFVFAHNSSIEKLVIGANIKSIGYGAFAGCTSLKYIEISSDNTEYCSVDNIIFNKNKTKIICYPSGKINEKYIMPETVCEIEDYSFSFAKNLKEVEFSDILEIIPTAAFIECSKLETVMIPSSVKEIHDMSFQDCVSLKYVFYYGDSAQWKKINKSSNISTLLDDKLILKDSDVNDTIKLTEEIELKYSSKVPFELKLSSKSVIKVEGTPKENSSGSYEVNAKIKPLKSGEVTISAVADNGFVLCNFNYTVEKCTHPDFHFTKTEKAATCTENGIEIYTCDFCDYTKEEIIPATNHSMSEWEVETKATKDHEGLEVRECTNYNCDYKEEKVIPKIPTTTEQESDSGNSSGNSSNDTSTEFLYGDVDRNHKINASDARKVLRYVAGLETLNGTQQKAADVDGNKKITATDARKILRHVAGLEKL